MDLPCQDEKYVKRIINFCVDIERSRGRNSAVYSNGNCGNLFSHLKSVFHCAKPFFSNYHVRTKIGRKYYDVDLWSTYDDDDDMMTNVYRSKPTKSEELKELLEMSNNYTYFAEDSKVRKVDKLQECMIDAYIRHIRCVNIETRLMDETSQRVRQFAQSPEFTN